MHTLITGTGRCGTGYIAKVLGGLHVRVAHEGVFNLRAPQVIAQSLDAVDVEVSGWGAQYLGEPWMDGINIVHLVRHPYHVIRSYLRMGFWTMVNYEPYRAMMRRYQPEVAGTNDLLLSTALFVLHWNERIEPHADVRHRVEDDVRELLDWMGVEHEGKALFANTRYNSRIVYPHEPDLTQLPEDVYRGLDTMAQRYGYELEGG